MDPKRPIAKLPIGARRDLLRILRSPSNVRADVIRQMVERPDTRELADVLMDLEAESLLRLDVMEAVRDSVRQDERKRG